MALHVIFRPDGTVSGPFADTSGHDGVAVEVPDDFSWTRYQADIETRSVVPAIAMRAAALIAEVNEAAEALRGRFLTAGSGQAMTYLRKEDEARRFDPEADAADYPFLAAEAASTGATLVDTAALVLAQANAWATLGAAIEAYRRGLIVAIEAAQNIETLDQLDVAAGWPGQAETQS